MSPVTVSNRDALVIVSAYAAGKGEQWIRDATGLDVRAIQEVAKRYGWPDREQLEVAVEELQARMPADGVSIDRLVNTALGSERAATRTLAERIRKDLDRLAERVQSESAETARKKREERERARLRTAERQLKEQLAEVQAQLRGKPATAAATPATSAPLGDFDPKVVRAWAREHGVECGEKGRVPGAVVEAWRAATTDQGSGAS